MKTVYLTKNLFSAVKNNGKLPKTDIFRANRLTDRAYRGYNPNRNDEVKNMKIKGFIFDLDGTLADTLPELPLTEDLPVVQEEALPDTLMPDTLPAADIQPDQPADTATLQHHAASQHEEPVTSEEKPETPKTETE